MSKGKGFQLNILYSPHTLHFISEKYTWTMNYNNDSTFYETLLFIIIEKDLFKLMSRIQGKGLS